MVKELTAHRFDRRRHETRKHEPHLSLFHKFNHHNRYKLLSASSTLNEPLQAILDFNFSHCVPSQSLMCCRHCFPTAASNRQPDSLVLLLVALRQLSQVHESAWHIVKWLSACCWDEQCWLTGQRHTQSTSCHAPSCRQQPLMFWLPDAAARDAAVVGAVLVDSTTLACRPQASIGTSSPCMSSSRLCDTTCCDCQPGKRAAVPHRHQRPQRFWLPTKQKQASHMHQASVP